MKKTNYDNIKKIKDKHEEEVKLLKERIAKLEEEVEYRKDKYDELRKQLFDSSYGPQVLKKKDKTIKDLELKVKKLEKALDNIDNYSCFNDEQQILIKNIRNLKPKVDAPLYSDIIEKYKLGTNIVLTLAKIAKNSKLEMSHCYIYVFRDTLICLLEKTMQAITSTKKSLPTILNAGAIFNHNFIKNIDPKIVNNLPILKDDEIYEKLFYLTHLENLAFHGVPHAGSKINDSMKEDIKYVKEFLNKDKDEQVDIFFSILKFLYEVFNSSEGEKVILLIAKAWSKK